MIAGCGVHIMGGGRGRHSRHIRYGRLQANMLSYGRLQANVLSYGWLQASVLSYGQLQASVAPKIPKEGRARTPGRLGAGSSRPHSARCGTWSPTRGY